MILIPEISTVVILVPRTGSGSLRRAIAHKYPKSILLYRHMEADGVPAGYDRWRKVGVVRDPIERLWSLYKFLQTFDAPNSDQGPEYRTAQVRSVQIPFEQWLMENQVVFTSPYDSANLGRFYPEYMIRHSLPENRKSQYVYLRPDLGTDITLYNNLWALAKKLDIMLPYHNVTDSEPYPKLEQATWDRMEQIFAWDFQQTRT